MKNITDVFNNVDGIKVIKYRDEVIFISVSKLKKVICRADLSLLKSWFEDNQEKNDFYALLLKKGGSYEALERVYIQNLINSIQMAYSFMI